MGSKPASCQGVMLSEVHEDIPQISYKSCMRYRELRYHLAQEGICKMQQRTLRMKIQVPFSTDQESPFYR